MTAAQVAAGQASSDALTAYAFTDTTSSVASGFDSASAAQPGSVGSPEPGMAFAAAVSGTASAGTTTPAEAVAAPIPSTAARRSTARRNAVATPAPLKWRTAIASFYDWNTWGFDAPGGLRGHTACGTRYTRDLVAVAAPPGMFACGTKIAFRVAGSSKVVVAPVLDSGYFSVLDSRRLWDLTSQACLLLRHCYTGTIEWAFWSGT